MKRILPKIPIAQNILIVIHEGVRMNYAVYTAANSGGHVLGGGTLVVGKRGTMVLVH